MRNMQKCEMPKNDNFSQSRGHEKIKFYRLYEKPFKMLKKTTSWPQDTWNVNVCSYGWEICKICEMPKNDIFSQVCELEYYNFFDFLKTLLKWWKLPAVDHWTVEMYTFAHLDEKYAKYVKCPKMTFFRRSANMKYFNFFDYLKKPFKIMKITISWPLDSWNVHICSFGWELCKNVKSPKMANFRRAVVVKNFNFFGLLKSLLK